MVELKDFLASNGEVQLQWRTSSMNLRLASVGWQSIRKEKKRELMSFELWIAQGKTLGIGEKAKRRESELYFEVANNLCKYYRYLGFTTESDWWQSVLKAMQQYAIVMDKTMCIFDSNGELWVVPANMDNIVVHEGIRPAYDWKFEICRTTKSGIIRQRGGENGMNSAIWCKIRPHTYKEYVTKFFAHLDKNEIVYGAYTDENIAMDMIKTAMHLMGSHKVKWIIE